MSSGRAVACLAVTQTVGYGVLYYAFADFIGPMSADLHVSATAVTGALTASVLAEAVAAVPIGRWVDRHSGGTVMLVGSVVESALLVAWSATGCVAVLYAVWIGIGLVSAAVLYETAFAVLMPWFAEPAERTRAVLAVTLTAGFASTIFIPGAAFLIDLVGWRDAVLVLAGCHAVVTIPLHLALRRRSGPTPRPAPRRRLAPPAESPFRSPAFWLFAFAFTANSASVYSIAVMLPTLLHALGHAPSVAATTTGLLGVFSVVGRLLGAARLGRLPIAFPVALLFAAQAVGTALLPVFGRGTWSAAGCVVGLGLGSGIASLARPLVLAQRFGVARFATVSSAWTLPATAAKSLAPVLLTALFQTSGPTPALAAIAVCAGLSALCLPVADVLAVRGRRRKEPLPAC